jgi:plastocyanin
MKTLFATLCACLALGLVAAGCGGDDNSNDSGAATPATTKEPADTTAKTEASGGGAAASVPVTMKDITFQPADVTVSKGGSVTWTNDDSVGHDVTKTDGPGPNFKSGAAGGLASGDTFTEKFNTPGTIKYVCTVHPGMEGTIIVKK